MKIYCSFIFYAGLHHLTYLFAHVVVRFSYFPKCDIYNLKMLSKKRLGITGIAIPFDGHFQLLGILVRTLLQLSER